MCDYKFRLTIVTFSQFYIIFVKFLERMFVFIRKCMNIFVLVIIDTIFPEKSDRSVESSNIFQCFYETCKFLLV